MRVGANDLFEEITSLGQKERFYAQCCGGQTESDESSWHGSDTDEEDVDSTASYAKRSTRSPTLSCNVTGSALTPQSPGHGSRNIPGAIFSPEIKASVSQKVPLQNVIYSAEKERSSHRHITMSKAPAKTVRQSLGRV